MHLTSRLLLIGLVTLILQGVGLYAFFDRVLLPDAYRLEKTLIDKNLHRSLALLHREIAHLENTTQLLSALPMIQEVILNPARNLPLTHTLLQKEMQDQDINFLYILNNHQQVLWEKMIDHRFLTQLWEYQPSFFKHTDTSTAQSGFYNSAMGPVLIVSAPIRNAEQTAIQGSLILGKLVTQDMLALIQGLSLTDLKILPFESHRDRENVFRVEDRGSLLHATLLVPEMNEKLYLVFSTTLTRDLTQMLKMHALKIIALLIITELILFTVILLFIYRDWLKPVKQLRQQIATGVVNLNKKAPNNEIGGLAKSLSEWWSGQEAQLDQAMALAYSQGKSESLQALQRERQSTMQSLLESLEWFEKKLSNLPTNEIEWLLAEGQTPQIFLQNLQKNLLKLQNINDQLRGYQKDTRHYLSELHSKILEQIYHLRAQAREARLQKMTITSSNHDE